MLNATNMQSEFGSTDAIASNGTTVQNVRTWEGKLLAVLGMLGGIAQINAAAMKLEADIEYGSIYNKFVTSVGLEYGDGFGSEKLLGDEFDFVSPIIYIPNNMTEWN